MFIANKKFSRAWEPVTEAATGDTFAVQPLLRDIECVILTVWALLSLILKG